MGKGCIERIKRRYGLSYLTVFLQVHNMDIREKKDNSLCVRIIKRITRSKIFLALVAIAALFCWAVVAFDPFASDSKVTFWRSVYWFDAISMSIIFLVSLGPRVKVSWMTGRQERLIKAPGTCLIALVDFLFRPATVELTFKPLIADWQSEYFDALNQGHTIKARWIMVRYRFHFARTFIMAIG